MSNIVMYPGTRRSRTDEAPIDTDADPLMGLGWLIAAVGFLCMLSAITLAALNLV